MWKDLTMEQRAEVIKMAIQGGLRNLTDIRSFYDNSLKREDGGSLNSYKENQFAKGGNKPVTTGGAGYIPKGYGLQQTGLSASIQDIKRRLYKGIDPYNPYSYDVIKAAAKTVLTGQVDNRFKYNYDVDGLGSVLSRNDRNKQKQADAIYGQYLGIPVEERYSKSNLKKSEYRPTKGDNAEDYYRLQLDRDTEESIVNNVTKNLNIGSNMISHALSGYNLGTHTIGRGYDNKGDYASYYDKWDLNPFIGEGKIGEAPFGITGDISLGIGNPVNIYDRIYLDDYYRVSEPTHATYLPEVTVYGRNKRASGGSIHIASSKRGTFTAAASKHGMGVQEFASKVLANKEDYSSAMVKKANFARNASKWKH